MTEQTTAGPGRPNNRPDSDYFDWCDKQIAAGVALDRITPTKCRNELGGNYGRAVELVNSWREKQKKQDAEKVTAAPAHLQEFIGKHYAALIGEVWPRAQKLAAAEWDNDRAALNEKLEQVQADNKHHVSYIEQLESRLENQAEQLVETQDERDNLQQQFESATESAGKLSVQLDETRNALEVAQIRETEREKWIDKLESELKGFEQAIDAVNEKYRESEQRAKTLAADLEKSLDRERAFEKQVVGLENRINKLVSDLQTLESKHNQDQNLLILGKAEFERVSAELNRVKNELADSQAKKDQAAQTSADLEKNIVELETRLAEKIEQLEKVLKENTDYRENGYKAVREVMIDEGEKRRVLKNEIDSLKKQLTDLTRERDQLLADMEQVTGSTEPA